MFLYHGTTKRVADLSLKEGLKPRNKKKSTWAVESANDSIYLTDAYAPFFSFNAGHIGHTRELAVIAIHTEKLNFMDFLPDEDALEQVDRISPNKTKFDRPVETMEERTAWFRDHAHTYPIRGIDYQWSLQVLGTCRHVGAIPPEAIVKIATWNEHETPLSFMFDPSITLVNYRIVGNRYRWCMREMMKDEQTEELSEFDKFGMDIDKIHELFDKIKITNR